jgi:hypothetical protein
MAPDPGGGKRTVGCSFERLVPDATHRVAIRDAVRRVHRATILATQLLNLHVRRCFEERGGAGLGRICDANWLLNAYNEVTASGKRAAKVDAELHQTKERFMPAFTPVDRKGLTQILTYECRNLAAVASNGVWMHFKKRLLAHVRLAFALTEAEYKALSKDERRARKLWQMQVADDMGRPPSEARRSPAEHHAWIAAERARLGIDVAVGEWALDADTGTPLPLLYHLKARPERFLHAMRLMSADRKAADKAALSLFPLRRAMVPRHIRFDQRALRDLLGLGLDDERRAQKTEAAKRRRTEAGRVDLEADGASTRKRRCKAELVDEKAQAFGQVLDLRAAKVSQRERFDFAFTTDGVCARLQCAVPKPGKKAAAERKAMPKRGLHAIDELKRVSKLAELHVVGIDPGIREMIVAVDQDDPKGTTPVRYTLAQRKKELRTRQYADEVKREKPFEVAAAEEELAATNSRAPSLAGFRAHVAEAHRTLDARLEWYAGLDHRRRRWKTCIKAQRSEQRLYDRLSGMHAAEDKRTLVLAYGAWGATDSASCVKRGNPPAVGVGLVRKLAKRFVVALTPEHHTSKTCCRCLGPCGPWKEKEEEWSKKVRGLRVCQDESCRLPQNRDRTGASNIGLNFRRLFEGQPCIRQMSDEEREFHRLNVECAACDAET